MAFLNKGLEIRFVDERPEAKPAQTFKYKDGIVDYVRHLNASKEALFRKVCSFEQKEDTMEVEIALQWNTGFYESIHSFANGISTIDGGMHEEGFKKSLTNVANKYARAKGTLEGEGRQPPRRGHPRGTHRHHLGASSGPPVRRPDQGQAGQRPGAFAGGAGHQRETDRLVRGEPTRSRPDHPEGIAGRPCPGGGTLGPGPHSAQVGARRRRIAGQVGGLFVAGSPRERIVHRRGKFGRRLGQGRRAIRRPRPSCPSAARSSTSNEPVSTRCSRTPRSRR